MTLPSFVPGEGPSSAEIMIVGEAPGKEEEAQSRPFVGPSGAILDDILHNCGIRRDSCYITNVCKIRPPGNDLDHLKDYIKDGVPLKIEDFLPILWKEIEAVRPNIIIGLGGTALQYLTGKDKITEWRGSILGCVHSSNIKTICTYHPASLFNRGVEKGNWKNKVIIEFDLKRAAEESKFPEIRRTPRFIKICKTSLDLYNFLNENRGKSLLSVDCEVLRSHLVCVGLAFDKYSAISIPLISPDFLDDTVETWKLLSSVLENPSITKLGQNFKADELYWLEKTGFKVNGEIHDLMYLMHSIYPELPKKLQFSTSIYTNEPYAKGEGKEYNPKKDKIDRLLHYNGMDCVLTYEAFEEAKIDAKSIINPLTGKSVYDFYKEYMYPFYKIYTNMERRGIKVDRAAKEELVKMYKERLEYKERLYSEEIGHPVNYNSPTQVAELIYKELHCPLRKDVQEETLVALSNNVIKDQHRKDIIKDTLELRRLSKAINTYLNCRIDPDDRIRCEWKFTGTETARSSTGIIGVPLRTVKWGISLQTLTKHGEYGGDIRSIFIPDEGYRFMEIDQAQAESRIADVFAEDYEFLAGRETCDTHSLVTSWLYNCDIKDINKEMRQVGKRASHAYDNGVGKHEFSVQMTKEMNRLFPGWSISEWRAGEFLKILGKKRPKIIEVFHRGIQDALANNNMVLWTPAGRYRQFFERWGREVFKEAYAHIKQAIVADNNRRGIKFLNTHAPWAELLVDSHDGILLQYSREREKELISLAKEGFLQPINFNHCTLKRNFELTIPIDIKVGDRWNKLEDVK